MEYIWELCPVKLPDSVVEVTEKIPAAEKKSKEWSQSESDISVEARYKAFTDTFIQIEMPIQIESKSI